MTYLIMGMMLILTGCTLTYISSVEPVNYQSTDPWNIMGSQNVTSLDKSAEGDAASSGQTSQEAAATPSVQVTVP